MRFIIGVIFGILLVALGGAAIVVTGAFNTAATVPPGRLEKQIAAYALDRSVSKRAREVKNPFPASAEVLREGLEEYRENCLVCHGAPGVDSGAIGVGLNPPPPDLTIPTVQARTDAQLHWLTSQGIRLTGMPAFGPTHSDEEIWKIVTFLRHLEALTPEEERFLKERPAEHSEETKSP